MLPHSNQSTWLFISILSFIAVAQKISKALLRGIWKRLGVCEYQNEKSGDYLYAYTPENLRCQAMHEEHIVQVCPCCGVGLLWYPYAALKDRCSRDPLVETKNT